MKCSAWFSIIVGLLMFVNLSTFRGATMPHPIKEMP